MKNILLKYQEKLKNLLKFIVFLMILYLVFNRITWIFRSNGTEAREDIYGFRNQGSVDVVLCAGSNLLRYYQPLEAWHQKGFTSYNYATSAAKADLLKAYIEESRVTNDAILYVCDIRSFPMVVEVVDDSSLRNWSDSLPVFSMARWDGVSTFLRSRNTEDVNVLSYYFDIIKYHTNTDALKSEDQWRWRDLSTIYSIDKGFGPNRNHVPFEEPERIYDVGTLTEQQEKAVDELLDYCDRNELNVLFICCPYIIPRADWLTINAVAEKITNRGYDYINFNDYYDEIGIDFETDFGDVNHVNFLGAEKYTQYLINYISDNYNLPDHRDDPEYNRWDDDYTEFATLQSEWKSAIASLVENHMNAKVIGEELVKKSDFYDWYKDVRNDNYSLIIKIKEMPSDVRMSSPLYQFMKDYKIDYGKKSYIGVWTGETSLVCTSDELSADFSIGVDGGRGTVPCRVEIESGKILIGEEDYSIYDSAIQVLVYDNNYQKVIDNVTFNINTEGTVELQRPL